MKLLWSTIIAAALVAGAAAFPGSLKTACKDLKVGTVIGGAMGVPAITASTAGKECTISIDKETSETAYTLGKKYTITVTANPAGNVLLYAEDACVAADLGSKQKLVGIESSKIITENVCVWQGTASKTTWTYEWTAPPGASGDTTFTAVCGSASYAGNYVAISDPETFPAPDGSQGATDCAAKAEAGKLTADPQTSCDDAGFTKISTTSTMTVCAHLVTDATKDTIAAAYDDVKADSVVFRMSVTGQYGALGFNSGVKMAGTEFMAVLKGSDGVQVKWGATVGKSGTALGDPVRVLDTKVASTDKTIAAEWVIRADHKTENGDFSIKDAVTTKTFIFATRPGAPGAVERHSFDGKGGGSCTVGSVKSECTLSAKLPATTGNLMHGSLMILAWIVLSPTGTFIARYLKQIGGAQWFKSHRNLQIAAVVLTILGLIIIFEAGVEYSDLEGDSLTHANYGLTVIGLSIYQVILGWARNVISAHKEGDGTPHGPRRWLFNLLHKINGHVLFPMGVVAVHAGLTVFPEGWVADPAPLLVIVWAIIMVVIGIAFDIMLAMTDENGYIPGYSDVSQHKVEKETELKIRSIVGSLAIAFTVATGIALIVIVADTDNTGEFSK